jgi:threonine synthase
MDIMISSNFERLLFDLYDRDSAEICRLMANARVGCMTLRSDVLSKAKTLFSTYPCGDSEMVDIIRTVYEGCGYLLDPHTAIGVGATRQSRSNQENPFITLATAHPAKFPDAIRRAGYSDDLALPPHMSDLFEREESYTVLDNDNEVVQRFIASKLG